MARIESTTTDRGEYRSIRRVLLDGPDFQRLSASERHVFLTLKLTAGPVGLEVEYEEATVVRLAAQTGIEPSVVRRAMAGLVASGWVRREANVFWVVGHIDHEPSRNSNDPKHRKSVQRYVNSLPRLEIVADFIVAHAEWFPADEYKAPAKGHGSPTEGPSKGLPSTETETETDSSPRGGGTSRTSRTSWLTPVTEAHEHIYGPGSFAPLVGRFAKSWRRLVEIHGGEKCARAWAFSQRDERRRQFNTPEYVASHFNDFDPDAPAFPEDGAAA
ncbi:MAG: hypothetical protein ACYCVL_10580 [Gemmatimonadaceae bacterium]